MDKNTIIGLVLIALLFVGFSIYQNNLEQQRFEEKRIQDSIALANKVVDKPSTIQDTTSITNTVKEEVADNKYKNTFLQSATDTQEEYFTLKNNKFELCFSNKGAQLSSAKILDYKSYTGDSLYLFNKGNAELGISFFAGETINTKYFTFKTVSHSDSSLVFRLYLDEDSYVQQSYQIFPDSYRLKNDLSFVNMEKYFSRSKTNYTLDWNVSFPRMEQSYSNESRYSYISFLYNGDSSPDDIGGGKSNEEEVKTSLNWFAFQQQFFSAILRAPEFFKSGNLDIKFAETDKEKENTLMTCHASMKGDLNIKSVSTIPFEYYLGPNSYTSLKSYNQNYEKILPLGGSIISYFNTFLIIPIFNWLNQFISSYGLIILILTLIIKIIVLPFTYKSYSSTAKMQLLQPEIAKINEKYPKKEDAIKKQQATMALYKRAGVSPLGGCLPMLFQLPILWAMFRFFPVSIELRQQPFLWATDLSSYDSIISWGWNITFLGDHISLFAILTAASMFLYSRLNQMQSGGANDENAKVMKLMSLWMMPIFMFFICNNLSSALSYYYLLSNIIMMLETWIIKKYFVHPEELYAKLKATEGKPMPKSSWQRKLEELQKAQNAKR